MSSRTAGKESPFGRQLLGGKLEVGRKLGAGSFGELYLGIVL
jgi:hypothetical protein